MQLLVQRSSNFSTARRGGLSHRDGMHNGRRNKQPCNDDQCFTAMDGILHGEGSGNQTYNVLKFERLLRWTGATMSLERFKCMQLSDVIATTSRLDHNPLGPPMLIRSKSNIAETDELMMIRALLRRQRKSRVQGHSKRLHRTLAHATACETMHTGRNGNSDAKLHPRMADGRKLVLQYELAKRTSAQPRHIHS